jgi:hypothetical protein
MAKSGNSLSKIIEQLKKLDAGQRQIVREELDSLDGTERMTTGSEDIGRLRGLGKEIWEGIDATEYVRQERVSWE